jgi:predicted dithiol-disulfide oxidoreductase (DUF899 family)
MVAKEREADTRETRSMTEHKVGTREEWEAARNALLEREKELTRLGDELARERRELPWVPIEKDYTFDTEDGTKTLAELFDGRSQLLVYHFMFGPSYQAGCPVCSSSADTVNGAVPHLNARDVTMLYVSRAPLEKLQAYKRRMGWGFPWVSSRDSDFNFDFGVSAPEEQISPLLEAGVPPVVERLAADCGTTPAWIHDRAASAERLRALRRRRLPDLLGLRPRRRDHDGLLPAARPRAQGTQRERL